MAFRRPSYGSAPLGILGQNAQADDLTFAKLYKFSSTPSQRVTPGFAVPKDALISTNVPAPKNADASSLRASEASSAPTSEVVNAAVLPYSPASTARSMTSTRHGGVDSPASTLGIDAADLPLPQPSGIASMMHATGTPMKEGMGGLDDDLVDAEDRTVNSPGAASSVSGAFGETLGSLADTGPMPPMPGSPGMAGAALPMSPAGSMMSSATGGVNTPSSYFRPDSALPDFPATALSTPGAAPGSSASARGPAMLPDSAGSTASARTSASSRLGASPVSGSSVKGSEPRGGKSGLMRFLHLPSSPGGRSAATGGAGSSPSGSVSSRSSGSSSPRRKKAPSPRNLALRRVLSMRVPELLPPGSLGASPARGGGASSPAFRGSARKPDVSSPLVRDALRKGMVSPAALNAQGRRALWRAASESHIDAPAAEGSEAGVESLAPAAAAAAAAEPAVAWGGAITAAEVTGSFPDRHTEYTVRVELGDGGAPLVLQRRYREFAALFRSVGGPDFESDSPSWATTWGPAVRRFTFPPKVLFRPTRASVVKERRAQLGKLLALLCSAACEVPEVRDELGLFCGLEEREEAEEA